MKMTIDLIIGIAGMFLIMLAFILDEFHKKWNQETAKYNLANILGSGLLIYYAVMLDSLPFIILNSVWLAGAVYKLINIVRR